MPSLFEMSMLTMVLQWYRALSRTTSDRLEAETCETFTLIKLVAPFFWIPNWPELSELLYSKLDDRLR
jgi:hypothetical protein